jgi:hypothetical protein
MLLHIMISQNIKKSNAKKKYYFLFHMMRCQSIFVQNKFTSQYIEKCKCPPKMIEMLFNLHEYFNIY